MAGYQFAHLDGYGRRGGKSKAGRVMSAQDIADEAERKPGAHDHVSEPRMPVQHFGVTPSEAVKLAHEWAAKAKDPKGRKVRIDGLCLAAGVVSVPDNFPHDKWPEYRDEIIKHLQKKYGERLKSVVEHLDEKYPHIHFYLVPLSDESFGSVHPGVAAARASAARGERKGMQNSAYKKAMIAWQEDIYTVSQSFGLARIGPRRRRLSRDEWKAEQRALSAHAALNISDKPIGLSMGRIKQIIAKQVVEHRAGLLGKGRALYTEEQLIKVAREAALYGAQHVKMQRLDVLGAVILHSSKIEAAEARLIKLAEEEVTLGIRIAEANDKVKAVDKEALERMRMALLKAEQAEDMAQQAESWTKLTVIEMEKRMKMVLSPILATLAAIIHDPNVVEAQLEADAAISALEELRPLALEIQRALHPVAKAANKTNKVKHALGLEPD